MRILFVGNEEEYAALIQTRENGIPFSLFFYPSLPDAQEQVNADAILMPALKFLSSATGSRYIPLIVSGLANLAETCFEAGCSDFIREPWTEDELQARVVHHSHKNLTLNHDGLRISGHTLIGPISEIVLSNDAYSILKLLVDNRGQPVPRMAIASLVGVHTPDSRSIDMRIARLRNALRSTGAGDLAKRLRCSHGSYCLCT